jgi:hypothetical protein
MSRIRQRALARAQARQQKAEQPTPEQKEAPVEEVKEEEDASELEYQWSSTEMENWSLKLKMANPDIDIPEVK